MFKMIITSYFQIFFSHFKLFTTGYHTKVLSLWIKKNLFNFTSHVRVSTAYFTLSRDLHQTPTSERILSKQDPLFIAWRIVNLKAQSELRSISFLPSDIAHTSIIHILPFARSGELNFNPIKSRHNTNHQWFIAEVIYM